jgi:hypothetical protein
MGQTLKQFELRLNSFEFESESNQTMSPALDALGRVLAACRHGDQLSPSPVPSCGTLYRRNPPPPGFSLMSPALKGHLPPPSPCFSPCATFLHVRSLCDPPSHHPTFCPPRPPALLQPPHSELPHPAIVVLRRQPLLTPCPPSPLVLRDPMKLVTSHRSPPAAINRRCTDRTLPSQSTRHYGELLDASPCPAAHPLQP